MNPNSPLGPLVRREDWYSIDERLTTVTVAIYKGDIVACSPKVYDILAGIPAPKDPTDDYENETEVIVVRYADIAGLLQKNGFMKF